MASRATIHDSDVGRLTDRASRILAALVTRYVDRAEPVSSLWLAQHGNVGLSSASVRNVMAELEQAGYISQPHTSAGRIPTDSRLPVFRGPAPEPPARHARRTGCRGAAAAGRHGERRPVERVPRAVGRLAPPGVRLPAPRRGGDLPAHRVRAARQHEDPGGGHDRRRRSGSQDRRPGPRKRTARRWSRAPATFPRRSPACRCGTFERRWSSNCVRSGCSTTSSARARCVWPV